MPFCSQLSTIAFQPFVSSSATLLKNEIRTTGFDYRSEFPRETKTSSRLSTHPYVTPNSLIPQTKKGIPPSKEQSRLGKLPHHPLSSPIRPTCIAPIKMAGDSFTQRPSMVISPPSHSSLPVPIQIAPHSNGELTAGFGLPALPVANPGQVPLSTSRRCSGSPPSCPCSSHMAQIYTLVLAGVLLAMDQRHFILHWIQENFMETGLIWERRC